MTNKEFKQLANKIYENAKNKGFHESKKDFRKAMMLVVEEVSELHSAYREGKLFQQCDKPIPDFTCFEEETADIAIRLLGDILAYEIDIDDVLYFMNERKKYSKYMSSDISVVCFNIINRIASTTFLLSIIGTVITLVEHFSAKKGYDLWNSIERKHAYNLTRPHLHGKKF